MPANYLLLKICILILPKLDAPLSVERPSFDGLEALLVLGAPKTVAIKLGAALDPSVMASLLDLFVESFFGAISCEDNVWKVNLQGSVNLKVDQLKMAYNCFQHKHQFSANSHTYFYEHTCTRDARLPKNHTHAYSKHFATQITYMHFFAKLIHMHT